MCAPGVLVVEDDIPPGLVELLVGIARGLEGADEAEGGGVDAEAGEDGEGVGKDVEEGAGDCLEHGLFELVHG